MRRPVKLDFEPLTLRETAEALGIPPTRARKILAMIGVDFDGRPLAATTGRRKNSARVRKSRTSPPKS